MTLRTRTELIQPKDTVQLTATFRDQFGAPADTDTFPQISIISPSGLVMVGPTSAGVMKLSTGKYQYNFDIGFSLGNLGVWADQWTGFINTNKIEATFNFVVNNTDQPGLDSDGYQHLGDEFAMDFSQTEIFNINKLLKTLRARLNSRGIKKSKDSFGNDIYVNCDIFSVDALVTFLANSITLFNEIPHFTYFTFENTEFVKQFMDVLVEGAVIWALASQALIERGGEASISDSSINYVPPTLSELLNTQSSALMTFHMEKLKFIKNSFKPHPLGLGGFSLSGSGRNPAIAKLRHMRERQII